MSSYTLFSYTVIRTSGEGFQDKQPYLCGLVEDNLGKHEVVYLDRFDGQKKVSIGAKVELKTIDENGLKIYGLVE